MTDFKKLTTAQIDDTFKVISKQLHRAIVQLDFKTIHHLISEKKVIQSKLKDYQLFRLLELAVTCYDAQLVRELLKHNVPLKSKEGGKLLWHAVGGNDLKIASMLIRAGVDLEVRNYNQLQSTVLHAFTKSSDPKDVKFAEFLMDAGANINAMDCTGRSVLFYALSNVKAKSILTKLLQREVHIDDNIFVPAAQRPDAIDLLPMLICKDATDLETKNRRVKIAVKQLCKNSANLPALQAVLNLINLPFEEVDKEQDLLLYAIDYALINGGMINMVNYLLECGVDVNHVSKGGMFPLFKAVSHEKGFKIAELLIEKGADIHMQSQHSGRFPIHIASRNCLHSNVELLLRNGASIDVLDFEGRTPYSSMPAGYHFDQIHRTAHVLIKYIAIQFSKKSRIRGADLMKIKLKGDFDQFFQTCLRDLKALEDRKVLEISLYSILAMKVEKLSILTKSEQFVMNFHGMEQPLCSIYAIDVYLAFGRACKRKNSLLLKEEALYEALYLYLPDLVIEKIAEFLWWCDK